MGIDSFENKIVKVVDQDKQTFKEVANLNENKGQEGKNIFDGIYNLYINSQWEIMYWINCLVKFWMWKKIYGELF